MTTMTREHRRKDWDELHRIIDANHHDPFSVLGRHPDGDEEFVRVYQPGAETVRIEDGDRNMQRITGTDMFEWRGPAGSLPEHYRIHCEYRDSASHSCFDPYSFPPQVGDLDIHLFNEGRHWHAYRFLGAHPRQVNGVAGILFSTWAPNAARVSVVGDFNQWDGRRHPMRVRGSSGIWELFIPGLEPGAMYKFELRNRADGMVYVKLDPYGQRFQLRPDNAAIVTSELPFVWQDQDWLEQRSQQDWQSAPMSIYEVHLASWQRRDNGHFLDYRELADRLVPYIKEQGFTHIELLPITEHPLDESWGYQTTGYYAATSRHGDPDGLRHLIDQCHQNGIGVLLDWVPAHFPKDAQGLARFDGTAVYEHEDPRQGEHRDWGTLIFNYGRSEVRNFLLSSAMYWMEEFHMDGLRVDAVASMLYLDYSREAGDWLPNRYGGNENLEAIDFLRELNQVLQSEHAGSLIIAEESTAWPQVTRPSWVGGLGFSMKWNMGWMHDSLEYMTQDPVYRHYHHDKLTFGLLYAFTENFVLPFSHDEVVHLKGSMLDKMPGDDWQRFANLRLLYSYQWTYPGKKLLFMGSEFAQGAEWNHAAALDWHLLEYPHHQGIQALVRDLNHLYRDLPALHARDFHPDGFEWIDCHDADQSAISYLRRHQDRSLIVALNFTPVPRHGYRIGVPEAGHFTEVFNSDSSYYGGSNIGNGGTIVSERIAWMGRDHSVSITLPPLAVVVFEHHPQ